MSIGHRGKTWLEESAWVEIECYIKADSRLLVALDSIGQHGPHLHVSTELAVSSVLSRHGDARIRMWFLRDTGGAGSIADRAFGNQEGLHAGPGEISVILSVKPDLVKTPPQLPGRPRVDCRLSAESAKARFPEGVWGGNPSLADPAIGAEILNEVAGTLARAVLEARQ